MGKTEQDMDVSSTIQRAERTLAKEHALSPALLQFLDAGKVVLLGGHPQTPPAPESDALRPLSDALESAAKALESELTLGLGEDELAAVAPLFAAFNLGAYCVEAAETLSPESERSLDEMLGSIEEMLAAIGDSPCLARLIPLNAIRRELLEAIPEGNRYLLPWLALHTEYSPDSLERIIQSWDQLWSKTANREDASDLIPVLHALQPDPALLDHLKSEAAFHRSVLSAAGELARQRHMERTRRSALAAPSLMDRLLSWLRMPAVAAALALTLVVGTTLMLRSGNGNAPIGVSMQMLVYRNSAAVRGGEEAPPEIFKQGDGSLRDGDSIQIRFELQESAYVYLYYQGAGKDPEQLFSGKLEKGIHVFPEGEKRMRLVKPEGDESITLIASSEAMPDSEINDVMNAEPSSTPFEPVVIHFQF